MSIVKFIYGTKESNSIPNKKHPIKTHYYKIKTLSLYLFGKRILILPIKRLRRFEYPYKNNEPDIIFKSKLILSLIVHSLWCLAFLNIILKLSGWDYIVGAITLLLLILFLSAIVNVFIL